LQLALLLSVALATLGAVDDLSKLRSGSRGMRARSKLITQVVICSVVALLVFRLHSQTPGALLLHLPLIHEPLALGWWFVPLAAAVMVGSSNAANLTDGLDGLAGGCLIFSTLGMAVLAYAAGHAELAQYLGVAHIPGASEAAVLAGGMVGGLLGFLWFNCHPAEVFMGDTGSLSLGGLLGFLAIVARQELLLLVVAGVLVVEAASVIVQVTVYKWRRRRVFLCAPLHHHFQFRGWPESRIVVRFWIVSALCALLGVAGTKLTVSDRSSALWRAESAPSAAVGDTRK
jgi:phospho-N-acetylmuramoyl-pentapeptide-transferase